ncbi:MAG: GNAT family N-acetyltransferase, partial [Lachnospiraceae bacterium]|nr:GNAT family N-acetyltransferase [Lachnospiraceae bacterium]
AYAQAFAEEEGTEPFLFYYEKNGKKAVNVIMRRDIAKDMHFRGKIPEHTYFDLITPYGYGGFFSENEFPEDFYKVYEAYCREKGYVCEFVRFELFYGYEKYFEGETECRTHNVVRNLQISLEDMCMDFEHKVRKNIKKAVRNGLEMMVEESTDHLEDFLRIYYETMERTGADRQFYFSENFFRTISQMKENMVYFYVLYEGKIIAAELVLYGAENAYSYLGGTDREYFALRPNDFLKYEMMKWLKEKGLKNFVLGGGYGADDGIFRYKKSFAPNGIADFYIGRKIFDEELYQRLVEMREEGDFEKESRFFPLYRS